MTVTIVAALGSNRAIGLDNALLWRLSDDLRHFKQLTLGGALVMGRATYESIGRPLPGRTTVVLTRDVSWSADGVLVARTLPDALATATAITDDVFVVGGGQVYAQVLDAGLADAMVLTHVDDAPEGDTWFPDMDWSTWQQESRIEHEGPPSYAIVRWVPRDPPHSKIAN